MKKKVLAMTLVGTLCTAMLAGCGGQASANGKAGGDAAATGDAYNVTVIVKHTDGHFNKVIAGAMAYGKEHDNVNVEIQSPTSATSYDEQVNMIETALGNPGIDAVVIAPQQSTSTATLVASADKPVLALDTDFTSDKKACFVGTGNEDAALNGRGGCAEPPQGTQQDKADGCYHRERTRATRPMKRVCAATAMRSRPQAVRCSVRAPTPCRTRQQPLWKRLSRSTRTV